MTRRTIGFGLISLIASSSAALAGPFLPAEDASVDPVAVETRLQSAAADALSGPTIGVPASWEVSARQPDRETAAERSERHPMIPLPPAAFAGLATLVAVSIYTVRQQKPRVGRR
jgi:hypothetical protein